ncbi:MAG: hypothetical protein KF819_00260 [Labilithrix sp.]|nr:hypothetical protein [Labilithrix sp.]
MRRLLRRVGILASVSACACVLMQACVLAEPSGDLPRLPPTRPTIIRGSVVPSASLVLATFPEVFIVPVELADPTQPFEYAAFIDYNAFTNAGMVVEPTQSFYEPSNTQGRVRILNVPLTAPSELDRCHVIEIVVALRLESNKSSQTAHTPAEPGGDMVTWFYNPSGDPGGCPATDAGIDARADSEGGEGGVQ